MGSTEENKSYMITITLKWFWLFTTKKDIKVITEDINNVFTDITEVINESKFICIKDCIFKCDNIDNITHKELK